MPTKDNPAPGWDAINQALWNLYRRKETKQFCSGGSADLDGISVYRSDSEAAHWHYVTYGFSDLYEKESVGEASGLGFELTFRLKRSFDCDGGEPPLWPCDVLNDLAQIVFQSGTPLYSGSHFELSEPIDKSGIQAFVFISDSELGCIDTAHGNLEFLQVVGVTGDEFDVLKQWRFDDFTAVLRNKTGNLLLTDLERDSILSDASVKHEIEDGISADGGSKAVIKCRAAEWIFSYKVSVSFSQDIIPEFKKALVERLTAGLDLTVLGPASTIVFRADRQADFTIENDVLKISLPVPDARTFADQLTEFPATYTIANLPVSLEVLDAASNSSEKTAESRLKTSGKKSRK